MPHPVDVYLHSDLGGRKHVAIKLQEFTPVKVVEVVMPHNRDGFSATQVVEIDYADDGSVVGMRIFACDVDRVRQMVGGDPINGVPHEPRDVVSVMGRLHDPAEYMNPDGAW